MPVKRVELKNFNISIGCNSPFSKATVRREFVDNSQLNIYHPIKGNPVVEDLMEKVVSNRSIPLDDGVETLIAIKEKFPYLRSYIDICIEELKGYRCMV